jgi:hypothetical protein
MSCGSQSAGRSLFGGAQVLPLLRLTLLLLLLLLLLDGATSCGAHRAPYSSLGLPEYTVIFFQRCTRDWWQCCCKLYRAGDALPEVRVLLTHFAAAAAAVSAGLTTLRGCSCGLPSCVTLSCAPATAWSV